MTSRPTLCLTCHCVFEDDYRDHMLDAHREQICRGDELWFQDIDATAWLLLADVANSAEGDTP